jgi:hypothetical protein
VKTSFSQDIQMQKLKLKLLCSTMWFSLSVLLPSVAQPTHRSSADTIGERGWGTASLIHSFKHIRTDPPHKITPGIRAATPKASFNLDSIEYSLIFIHSELIGYFRPGETIPSANFLSISELTHISQYKLNIMATTLKNRIILGYLPNIPNSPKNP